MFNGFVGKNTSSKNYDDKSCDNKKYFLKWTEKEETTNTEHQSFPQRKCSCLCGVKIFLEFNLLRKQRALLPLSVCWEVFRGQRRVGIRRKKRTISLIKTFLSLLLNKGQMLFV